MLTTVCAASDIAAEAGGRFAHREARVAPLSRIARRAGVS